MQNQFKPGDLALVIGSTNPGSPNVGMSVELIRYCRYGDMVRHADASIGKYVGPGGWLAVAEGLLLMESYSDGSKRWKDRGGSSLIAERHLMPLKGTETPQLEKQKEVEHG